MPNLDPDKTRRATEERDAIIMDVVSGSAAKKSMVCLEDFERYAVASLPRDVLDFYRDGADDQTTVKDNVSAFARYKILPRVLVNVSKIDTSTTIVGHPISSPLLVAPTAMHCMAHPEGEIASARGAARVDVGFTLSTASTCSIEDVAAAVSSGLMFFQLYVFRDRSLTVQLIAKAERSGYKALVITVDVPYVGKRRADIVNGFTLPQHLKCVNIPDYEDVREHREITTHKYLHNSVFESGLQWSDIAWIRSLTTLPIIIKGILRALDAVKAVECGIQGILVSNHGGRQLNNVPATIDVLSEIVAAVNGRCEVYLDGGVRLGTDVLIALALGARAVFIGRPVIYALAYNGEEGVSDMLQILKDEFKTSLALSGCTSVNELSPDLIRRHVLLQEVTSKL